MLCIILLRWAVYIHLYIIVQELYPAKGIDERYMYMYMYVWLCAGSLAKHLQQYYTWQDEQ